MRATRRDNLITEARFTELLCYHVDVQEGGSSICHVCHELGSTNFVLASLFNLLHFGFSCRLEREKQSELSIATFQSLERQQNFFIVGQNVRDTFRNSPLSPISVLEYRTLLLN